MAYDLGTARGTIELTYEGKDAVNKVDKDMDRVGKKSDDTDKHLKKLGATLSGLASGAKIGLVAVGLTQAAVAAANMVVQVAGMVPQLTSIASLSAALPATFVGVAAALGTVKAITAGLGDTIKAAFDPKGAAKFEESLKQLSPAAQEFAKAIQANVKPLQDYQKGIQEAFFSQAGLTAAVPRVVGLLKSISPVLSTLTGEFARITRQVVDLGTSSQTVSFVRDSISAFTASLSEASRAIEPLFTGLRAVGTVGLPLLTRLGEAAGNVGTAFGNWLSEVANNGQLQTWINTAIDTLKTLGGIAKNVGTILFSIFQAAGDTSGGLLNNLKTITGQFATFLSSAEGAAAIRSLFTGIGAAASALAPIVTTLAGVLASALGPALLRLATVLGPVLIQVVDALAPAFGPLADAIVSVVQAISPLLPPFAQLVGVVAQLAGGILQTVAAEFGPLIAVLGPALSGALAQLAPVISEVLVRGLPLAAQAGQALAEAFAPLVPILLEFAGALAGSIMENLPAFFDAVQKLIPAIAQFATALSGSLGAALQAIIPLIPAIVQGFVLFVNAATTIQAAVLKVYAVFVAFNTYLFSIPGKLSASFSMLVSIITGAFNTVVSFLGTALTTIVNFFVALPGRIGSALAALPGAILNVIKSVASTAAFQFGAMIGTLVSLAVNTPGRIASALGGLVSAVSGVVRSAWNAARAAFSAGINGAVSLATSLGPRTRSAISSLISGISGVAKSAWSSLRSAFSSGISQAASLAGTLPNRIKGAIGNLGGLLIGVGRDAVQGLINGLRSGVGAAADAARSLGSSIMNGIRSTLKIGSPSKEMIKIGRFVTQGLVIGLNGTITQVRAAATKLANYVNDAFSDKLIKKSQRNSVLSTLSKGTAQLAALTTKSAAVASKLKAAQTSLAAVQKQYNDTYAAAVEKTKQTFSLVTAGQSFVNLDLTKERFQAAVDQAKKFAANIQALAKRGLSKDLLQQLVDAGAADGGAMAAALAGASDATLKEFNNLQGQLTGAANTVGKTTADALYGAGLQAAKGLVDGLAKQQAAIQKQMDKIAASMIASIKKALKIKSPSRVMFGLGKFTTEGLVNGLASLRRQVEAAASKIATASIIPTVQLAANTNSTQAQQAASSTVVGGTSYSVQQNVYALPGMSAQQVAAFSLTKLRYGLTSGIVAAALPTPSTAGV